MVYSNWNLSFVEKGGKKERRQFGFYPLREGVEVVDWGRWDFSVAVVDEWMDGWAIFEFIKDLWWGWGLLDSILCISRGRR